MYSRRIPASPEQQHSRDATPTETTEQLLRFQSMTPNAEVRVQHKELHLDPQAEERNRVPVVAGSIEDRYRILLDASSAMARQPTVNDVLRSLRSLLSKISCVYSAGLYLFTDDRRGLKLFAYDRDADGIAVPIGTEVPCTEAFGQAVESQRPVYLPDVAQEMLKVQELAPFASRIGVRRAYVFPVATSRKQYGVVAFTSEQGRDFSPHDVELMGSLAPHIALAVETFAYQQQLAEEQDRVRASHAELKRSEAYLAEGQRLSHTGSWAFDVASNEYVYASEECFRIFGLDPQNPLPTREVIFGRIHPDDSERVNRGFEKAVREKVDTSDEFRLVLPGGAVKNVHVIRHPVLNSAGDVVKLFGTTVDITERKRTEDELRTSRVQLAHERDRLSLLLQINNLVISKLEIDELFRAIAGALRKHFGNDLTSLWLFDKETGYLERKYLNFPTGKGILEKVAVFMPTKMFEEWWPLGRPHFYSPGASELSPNLREAKIAESLSSSVIVPLIGVKGPLGALAMDSRKENAFSEADRDLLSQIGTQISLVLDNALAYGRLRVSRDHLEDQRVYLESEISSEYNFEDIVGKSSAIKRVLQQLAVVAPTDSTILLHGETGTGKELMARAIHNLSSRRECSFVRMNCAAIPSGLLESELFGHEKGAFTGALMQRRGRFELADHGTLFLDEIGDISLELQPKLLRAVQEQEFERLGSAKTIHVDVRIIAATHRDLAAMIREGKFREDLFYRLNVFPIQIPPLRERREDIPLLVNYFVAKLSRRIGKKIKSISRETMDILTKNPWPGNVRELANVLERAVILTQGDQLELPIPELHPSSVGQVVAPMVATVQEAERAMIMEALRASGGRISGEQGAAKRLGLKRTTLQHKMHRLGIKPILNIAGAALPKVGIPDKR